MVHPARLHNKYRLLISISGLISLCWCCVTPTGHDGVVQHIPDARLTVVQDITYWNQQPFSGYLLQLDSSTHDTLVYAGYKKGQPHGIHKKWYAPHRLQEVRYYEDGQKHGQQVTYWENGNKKFEFTAQHDQYEGELREWLPDGRLVHLGTYHLGQEEGPQKMWYDNGKVRANYIMVGGKRYGLLGTKNCKNVSDSIFVVQ